MHTAQNDDVDNMRVNPPLRCDNVTTPTLSPGCNLTSQVAELLDPICNAGQPTQPYVIVKVAMRPTVTAGGGMNVFERHLKIWVNASEGEHDTRGDAALLPHKFACMMRASATRYIWCTLLPLG